MSRESGSDQTQRTVAELLAQYGGSAESAPRRRRRRADDEDDVQQPETAPQTIIERVLSDSGRLMAIRDDDAPQPGRRAAPEPPAERTAYQPKQQVAPPKPPQPSQQMPVPQAQPPLVRRPAPQQPKPAPPAPKPVPPVAPLPPPAAAEQTRQVPQVRDQPSRSDMPRPDVPGRLEARLDQSAGAPSRTNITRPPKPPQPSVQMPVPGPPREAMTEQLPRIPAKAPVDKIAALETESVLIVPPAPPKLPEPLPGNVPDAWFSDDDAQAKTDLSMPPMESTAAHPAPYVDDDSQEYAAYRAEDDYLADADEEDDEDDEGPAGLDDAADVEEDQDAEPRSAGKEWLIMIGQLAVGVLGGAALWLAFNYLWRSVPAAALVVALAVTVGLVLLVRKIRRADDLQTTVLAVLVGLIVTVSPAAMLLVKN
ncbi:hypothetical protein SAMN04488564_11981 [Lentzea waywayandensis]|uniref:Transmembrane protein n=1 Tax=Lentzea waywayandensis TaxID=84724 RepID=A0A1I6FI11_9PSEU|nr:hypothetical protein [Lentzea waywayandensis]SFR29437.1 hypothetical protein SAMN04488564_11981 [Lentzea waywayandensis]